MGSKLQIRAIAILLIVNFTLVMGACKNSDSSQDTTQKSGLTATEPAAKASTSTAPEKTPQAEAPPAGLYEGIHLGALSVDKRQRFVSMAKTELCPCPDSSQSLHQCLQSEQTACGLAKTVAGTAARGLKHGLSETDVLTRVAELVEAAKKTYEFDLVNAPVKGNPEAPVVLVEFADFQCPHCKRASKVIDTLVKEHGEEFAVYYKHFPLGGHGQSELAARASMAAKRQGRFWQMHDLLFEHQRSLSPDKIERFARRLGMNVTKFKGDLNSPEIAQLVRSDKAEAKKANIRGTPALFINGKKYLGPNTVEAMSGALGLGGQAKK